MAYPEAAWERAMTVQEVILKAFSGELHWFRAAEILGWSPRTLRRWRERYETHGHSGLIDRRLLRPSKRRVRNLWARPETTHRTSCPSFSRYSSTTRLRSACPMPSPTTP